MTRARDDRGSLHGFVQPNVWLKLQAVAGNAAWQSPPSQLTYALSALYSQSLWKDNVREN